MTNYYKTWLSNTLINHTSTMAPSAFLNKLLFVFALFFLTATSWGQVANYSFISSSGTYTPITGGSNIPSTSSSTLDDNVNSTSLPIGFAFVFNGQNYTDFGYNANGWISLGTALPTNSSSPISNTSTTYPVISPFGTDLIGRIMLTGNRTSGSNIVTITTGDITQLSVGDIITASSGIPANTTITAISGSTITMSANATSASTGFNVRVFKSNAGIRYETIGSAPNRSLVVQWSGFNRYATSGAFGEVINFQIILNETSNTINFVYNISGPSSTSALTPQVGIRGLLNTEFNIRSSISSWTSTTNATLNSSTLTYSNSIKPALGLTFTWTPPNLCSGTPTPGTIPSNTSQNVCSGATPAALTVTGTTSGVTGITFQWEQSTDNATWTNASGGTGATTASYTPPSFLGTTIYYRCKVTCSSSSLFDVTNVATIAPPANPTTQASNVTFTNVNYTSFTASWTNGNGNRRVVYVSNAAITDPTNNSGAAALTSNTVYSGSGQQIVFDGTGTSVTVTGLALGTSYNVKVIEYTRCGTTTFDNYFNVTSGTNSSSVTTTAVTAVPWSEGFATTTLPSGWLNTSSLTISASVSDLNPALATNYMYTNIYDDGWGSYYPSANFSTPIFAALPSNYRLFFNYKINNYGASTAPGAGTGNIVVAISTNNGSSFTTLQTINNNGITGWQNVVIDLSAYANQSIRLRFTSTIVGYQDYYVAFDNFKIEEIPAPTITNVTSSIACGQTSSVITITGTGLTNTTSVKIGGVTISPLASNTDTQITAVVSSTVSGTVEVITNAGSVISSGSVSFAISPALSLNSATQTNCAGVTNSTLTTLTSTAADYDTYTWSPSTNISGDATNGWTFNPTATTTYTLTASNSAGCSRTAIKTITVNPLPSAVSVSPGTTVIAPNSITTLTASGGTIASNQNVSNYTFSASTGTYNSITGTTVSPSTTDDNGVGNLPIGFTFPYNGGTQTVFGISTNGLLLLGNTSTSITGFSSNGLATNANVIAPLWDDNNIVGGSMSYLTTGITPNRVLTVQWTNLHIGGSGSTSNPTISMQVKLFENGDIQFVYGSTSATLSSPTASIGISGASGNYLSVSPAATISNSTASSSAENTSVATSPLIAGTTFNFTRPIIIGTSIAWSPITDLYTDAGATSAYTGGAATTVYAKPTATTTYTATATSPSGCTSNSSTTLKIGNTWTGTTSNSWNTPSNWSANAVPTSLDDVLITSDGSNAPILDVDITIPAGKSLTLSGTGSLTVAPGKVLTIAGTANFSARPVIFKSDATGSAMLGSLTGTLTGASNVTVERFIPSGKRAFRLLSPAVTTTNFISDNWQQQTHITGGASGGFDVTETNNPSMFTYNNQAASGTGWTAIANTNATNLTAGVGYRMLVRGDRTASNITAASADSMNTAVTLSATGTLRTGTVTLNSSSTPSINNTSNTTTADYSLIGNPYQSAVDWNAVTKSGIDATYWAWDPNMGTTAQRGRYVSFNGTVNSVDGGVGSSNVGQFIQPGQAFFVKNTTPGTAGTLTFQEAHKATTNANVFRTANPTTLTVSLYDPNELAIGGYPIDATKAVFSTDYSNELGLGDAAKLEAAGENIAWFRNNTKLAIEAVTPATSSDELVMKTIRLGANRNYTFKINTTNFDADLTPYLVDNFLNTQTQISTSEVYLANFSTTSNVTSYGEDRFKIVFQNRILDTNDFVKNIKLYPNPAKACASFYLDGITEATVSVYNVVGQNIPVTVMSQGNAVQVTPKTALSQGVYLITVTTAGKTAQVKWIVE